jgi:signal transduction histidine kinase
VDGIIQQRKYSIFFIIASTLLITYLHYSTHPRIHDLHNVYAEFYYLPLLISALVFGLRGALITYLCVSLLYAPYVFLNWTGTFSFAVNKLSHALFSGAIALLSGFLVDREKRLRKQAEKDHYLASLGQAAAAIVHDLKNPLITVSGFARRIGEGKGDVKTSSETILDSAARMQMIVTDVLDFAKPVKLVLQDEDHGQRKKRLT